MAKGDQDEIKGRLRELLPPAWFSSDSPILDAILTAGAQALAWCHSLLTLAGLQTRIGTASEGWLDLIAHDFFGKEVQRAMGEPDEVFRDQIRNSLFSEKGTRQSITDTLKNMTGHTPVIFEPQRPMDTGVYGGPMTGYGAAGGYGSCVLPCQAFIIVHRPAGAGIPCVAGYASGTSGYSIASRGEYASQKMIYGFVKDPQIYSAIAAIKPEGTLVWVRII